MARAYTRVSTSLQINGASIDTQIDLIKRYCKYKNLELLKVYKDECISGKNMERPQLQLLFSEMQAGERLIISDLSRLGRNTMDCIKMLNIFDEQKIVFVCLSPQIDYSTAMGRMVATVLMSTYQYQRELQSEQISANMKQLSAAGKLRSCPAFGWKFVSKELPFQEIPEQQQIIQKISDQLNTDGDNKHLDLHKKTAIPDQQFTQSIVRTILVNHGSVPNSKRKAKKSIDERIVSHYKHK